MKKIFTLFIFCFLASSFLFGQCPDEATPNPTNRTFNMSYYLEADRDAAWNALDSITFPAGTGCMCGQIVTLAKSGFTIDGPVSANNVYRIRATVATNDYFGGVNGDFVGDLIFHMADSTAVTCAYDGMTSNSNLNETASVRIFPNPVNDQMTIINGEGKVTIYNSLGQPIKQKNIDASSTTIQVAGLLSGQYYLQVIQRDGTSVIKQFSKTY